MKYAEYLAFRDRQLAARPGLIDAGETNLYRALESLSPHLPDPPGERLHRCHLATQWAANFGFPLEVASRAFVSTGVRHSLELLFCEWARTGARLWLPEDNYPVFGELAIAAGLVPMAFQTLPEPMLPSPSPSPGAVPFEGDEILLVTNPLKPRGRFLNDSEIVALKNWLQQSPRRRLIIDAVYSLTPRFHSGTATLLATSQTILLHSLTKGWLHPRLFGIALTPAHDAERWKPIFRAAALPQANLAAARHFLEHYPERPAQIADRLHQAHTSLAAILPQEILLTLLAQNAESPGYFIPVERSFDSLLEMGVLGIPSSVFGSNRDQLTILSSLAQI